MEIVGRMNIVWRITSGFMLAVLLLVVLALFIFAKASTSERAVRSLVEHYFIASSKMQTVDGNVIRIHRAMKDAALASTPQALDKAIAQIPDFEKAIDTDMSLVKATGVVPSEDLERINKSLSTWQSFRQNTVELLRENKREEAAERTRAQGAALAAELISSVAKVVGNTQKAAKDKSEDTISMIRSTSFVMIGACAVAGLAMVIYGMIIVGSMKGPIAQAVEVAEEVAAGRLGGAITVPTGTDEFSRLLQALGRMNHNLLDVFGRIRSASENIATGSAEIATGNSDLSQRTEEQASNLQQTAASMEQLSGTVKLSADTAAQASRLAADASASAARGGEVVGNVISTMNDIAVSSKKIADITGVIDSIAFQTNILALNAAVEAARAGEQGRGFAVVASEVRSLASRSAEAAREIKSLISSSQEKVDAGSRLVDATGASMTEIVAQVQRVNQMIGELSSASSEQAQGIEQVCTAVSVLDDVTQQNAALVEQNAAASESLKQQAALLNDVISSFVIAEADSGRSKQHSMAS